MIFSMIFLDIIVYYRRKVFSITLSKVFDPIELKGFFPCLKTFCQPNTLFNRPCVNVSFSSFLLSVRRGKT